MEKRIQTASDFLENGLGASDLLDFLLTDTPAGTEASQENKLVQYEFWDAPAITEEEGEELGQTEVMTEEDSLSVRSAVSILLNRLDEVEVELQKASYTIGFLKSELDGCKGQLKLLPDLEAQANRVAEVEIQNQELRNKLPDLEKSAIQLAQLQKENENLRIQLQEFYEYRQNRSDGSWNAAFAQFWRDLVDGIVGGTRVSRPSDAMRLSKYDRQWAYLDANYEEGVEARSPSRYRA